MRNRETDSEESDAESAPLCFLCQRPLGETIEWHHPVPKSRGGRARSAIHPICHQTIHANFTNSQLAREFSTREALSGHPEIARFLLWIADKPPDFHAPTRTRK